MVMRKFVWAEDEDMGGEGWKPMGSPSHFNCGLGLQVTHDTIEHFNMTDFSIEAEFMAFGAILWIRGNGNYWSNKGSFHTAPSYQMYGEIVSFLSNEDWHIRDPGRVHRIDDLMEHELVVAKRNAYEEAILYVDEGDDRYKEAIDRAQKWMRKGYRKAARRFRGHSAYDVCQMFMNIENLIDYRHKHGNYGDELHVSFSIKDLSFRIKQTHNEFGDY